MNKKLRFLLLGSLFVLLGVGYFLKGSGYFSFEILKNYREKLLTLVEDYKTSMILGYIAVYILVTALSLPFGAVLTVLGGFLFLQPSAFFLAWIGALIGATLIFMVAKILFGNMITKKLGKQFKTFEKEVHQNGSMYLLFVRLVPIFPFWLVNMASASLGVKIFTYIWTTAIGIIPGTFAYSQAGVGLGAIFDSGKAFTLETVFNWQMKVALIALGLFALLPVIIKKVRARNDR